MLTPFPWRIIQHIILPQYCVLCGQVTLNRDFSQVCSECLEDLKPIPEPVCVVCGKPLPGGIYSLADTCSSCRSDPPPFDMARAWGPYQGGLRELLRALKYQGLKPLAGPLSGYLETVFNQQFPESFDWIIPVPLHRKRLLERGYDQAFLLSRRLSARTGIPTLQCAIRVRETQPQHGLSATGRKLNMAGAFALKRKILLKNSRILVLDDVLTTGSTVSALCKCLRKQLSLEFIGVLTVARAIRHGPTN
ncbi:MAG: ComF family protein [Acidobacteriota bacterium]